VLIVEPHAVFVGAVLGGGKSEIEFIGAFANMKGVNGFAEIVLANGVKHSLTLTAANFIDVTGGVITVFDGIKGNNVSAAGVTNAIIVHAGSGTDVLTGGAGNDIFYAGGRTTMTGGAGTNEFVFTRPGSNKITDFSLFSATNELVFSNSGFGLKLTNATMTPMVLPSRLVAVNSTGSFTNKNQRFAYDTNNGDLFYSATGTTATEHLVVALTGAPPLTTTANPHLFYIT
jgi:Ca2+-binding RTX toxin-like protein